MLIIRVAKDFVTLSFLDYLKLYFFEYEHVVVNSTRYRLDATAIGKPACLERLKADNTARVDRIFIVTVNTVRYHSVVLAISQG
ncbi:hypothetical protein Tco_0480452 [Tanacetum coccineum]